MILVLIITSVVMGVSPVTWRHSSEATFAKGEFKSTVVSSLGEISLARGLKVLLPSKKAPAVFSAVVAGDKCLYASSGCGGDIYKITGTKVAKFAKLPATMVTSLHWTGKKLLAGGSGSKAGIYSIDSVGKSKILWSNKNVKYVWAIVSGPKCLYAATGPKAKVFSIDPAGKGTVIYEIPKLAKNILCLARNEKGLLYAGTDSSGLILEIDPEKKDGRILFDSPEKEISAILPDGRGGLYAATADTAKASASGQVKRSTKKVGKATKVPPKKTVKAKTKVKAKPSVKKPAAMAKKKIIRRKIVRRLPKSRPTATKLSAKGNAVYHISANGLVQTIFRKKVTVLAMIRQGDRLILGTGNGGMIYSVSLDGDVITQLADTDAKQITALADNGKGNIVFTSSNKGSIVLMSKTPAADGTYISSVQDAKQITLWGTIKLDASTPAGCKLTVATRSGNVAKADDKTWSRWSPEQAVGDDFLRVMSPGGRFLQYRLTMKSARNASPILRQMQIIHQVGNLAPVVSGITVQPGAAKSSSALKPKIYRAVTIAARDDNKDRLKYTIEFRQGDSETWIKITDKLTQPKFVWDIRTVGDGLYQLRVTASDEPSNPPAAALSAARLSDVFVVDTTPPLVKALAGRAIESGASIRGEAIDSAARIVSIQYAVDSNKKWITVLPTDGIADSNREKFAFEVEDLDSGAHRIAIRVTDLYGNTGYAALTVNVAK